MDEAGRGPVIGPLVVACVVLDEEGLAALRGLVRDSKSLTAGARLRLYSLIQRVAVEVGIRRVDPEEVDEAVAHLERGLNELEAMVTAQLVGGLRVAVSRVYVDSPDPRPGRYAEIVRRHLPASRRDVEVVAANRAESIFPHVAAASVVAKVERDRAVEELKRVYGDFGSGYPSDPKTRRFLAEALRRGEIPPIVRRSWRTLRGLMEQG